MANRYWVGGAGTWNTTSTTNWSASSGGASGASVPTAADSVFFDQAGTYTVTMTGALLCLDITVSAGTVTFATGTTPTLAVTGSMSLLAGTVWSSTGAITFNATTTGKTITTNGVTINAPISFSGTNGGWSLGSSLTLGSTLTTTLTAGTLTLNGFNLTTGVFASTGTTARSIAFGTNNIVLVHTTAATTVLSFATATGFTWTGTTGGFSADASITRTYVFGTTGGSSTNAPNLSITSGAAIPTITTASWFNNLDFTGSTCTPAVTSLNLAGNLTLATGGTYTNLTITTVGTTTVSLTGNSKTVAALTINSNLVTISGTLNITGSLSITGGVTFSFTSGTLNPGTVDISSTNTTFTYGGTAVLGAVTAFNTIASVAGGSININKDYSLTSTGTFSFNGGILNLNATLTTGQFSTTGSGVRTLNFNTYNIILAHTTAGTTVLSCATVTNMTTTGTGGFVSDASITRTYTFGTTGGSTTNAPNLKISSGTAVPTFTSCWFNTLDFTGSSVTSTSATTVLVSSIILSTGGTYTNLNLQMEGTGSVTTNGKTVADFSVNQAVATLSGSVTCASGTFFNGGSLNCSNFNITCSGTMSYRGTTLTNIGTITCATWQMQVATFNFTQGTINPSVSFVLTSGTFNYNGGTLGAVPTFTHTAGTVTLGNSYALTTTGTYTFNGGQINLANYTLTTGIFNAAGAGTTRNIDFATSSLLQITGNNATILDFSNLNGYTGTIQISCTYVGSVGTRTINISNFAEATAFDLKCSSCVGIQIYSAATDIIAPSGAIKTLDLTGMNFTLTQGTMTVYGDYTIPATGGSVSASASTTTFASTNATARTITIARSVDFPISLSGVGGTFQLGANLTVTGGTRMFALLNGTFSLNGYNLTVGYFQTNNSNIRTLNFGSNSITVNGTATPWDTTVTTNLTVTGSRTVNVTTPSGTITVIPGVISEAYAFDFNISGAATINFMTVAGHAARNVDFTGFSGTTAATAACTIYGSLTLSTGMTFNSSGGAMTFGATSGTNTINSNGKTLTPIIINGVGGTFNLASALTSSGSIQVLAGTFDTTASNFNIVCTALDSATATNTRSILLNGSTVTISGTSGLTLNESNLTFNTGTSQITLSNATSTVLSMLGSATFRNVSITGGAPLVTIVGTNTYNNLTFTNGSTVPSVVTITGNQTVNGTLSNSSTNATTRLQLQSSVTGTQIILSAGVESLNDVDFKDIDAAGTAAPFAGTRLGNLGNNTDITFDAGKTVYWSLAAGGNWNATAWATTSGGTPDVNNFPLAQDTCIIQNTGLNTSATITMNGNWTFGTMDMSTRSNAMTLAIGTTSPIVTGNWSNGSGTTLTGTGTVNFKNTGTTQTITPAGITFTPNINYDSVGGTFQLAAALTLGATSTFTLTKGTLSLNSPGFTLTTGAFSSNNSFTRSISFGSGSIVLAHTTAATNVLDMANLSNFSMSGTGQFTTTMGVTRTFTTGTLGAVTGSLALNGTNQYVGITSGSGGVNWSGTLDLLTTFTVESWINLSSTPASGATIAAIWQKGGSTTLGWAFYVNSSRQLAVDWGSEASGISLTGGTIPLSTWTHVAWVGSGTNHFLYVNGVLVATAGSAFSHSSPDANFTVGVRLVNAGGPQQYFAGNISNLRIVNGLQVYTGTFTPPTSPLYPTQSSGTNIAAIPAGYTELLLNTPNNASFLADGSTNNFTLFNTNTAVASASTPITSLPAAGTPPSLGILSGASIPTFASGSYFTNLDFTGSTCTPAASSITVNGNLTLATGGTYTSLGVTMGGTGTITPTGKTIAAFTINTTGTVTLAAAFGCTSFTMTAGTINFASFQLTDSGTATYTAGTMNNIGVITCTTWTTQGTFAHSTGTITPSTSFVITSGSYTQTGTSVLSAVPTFTQTAGNVTFRSTYALTATGTYTLTAGTLTLGGNLTTGIFSSTNTNVRSIAFSTFNIVLAHTTAAQTVLGMDNLTNFSWTGTGGFTSAMSVTRTFQSGQTAGATSTSVPNLSLTSGASIPTITTGGSFKNLDFTGSTCAPASTSISVYGNLTLASGGTYSTFTAIMVGSAGNVNSGGSTSLLGLNINNSGGTTTLTAALTLTATGVTTLTSGNLNLGGFTLTTGTFSSNNTNVRSITFGTSNIILATTTAAAVNLAMADVTNFTYTSGGTYGSGTGCFQSTMSATRTFQFGSTAGGSASNAIRLYLASGASVATLTTGSWFAELDFGTTAYTNAATNLNLRSLKSDLSTSVLTSVTATMIGSGSIRTNTSIGPLVINTAGITTTLAGTTLCTTATLTQGTLDLATLTLTCSSTFTWNGGSLLNFGTLSCTTFTLNGPTFTLTSGTLNPSTSFVLTTGSFTYGGTATLGATTTFTHTAGSVTFNKSYALNAASTYTLSSGTLTLAENVTLSTGIFSSSNTATRSIAFGSTIVSGNVLFNGTSSYLTTSGTTGDRFDLADGAGNWTVECWFNMSNTTGTRSVFWKGGATGSVNPSYAFSVVGGTGQWIVGDGSSGGAVQNLATTFSTNTWYHFALVRNGSTLTAYVNGVADTPVSMSFTMDNTVNNLLAIGNAADGASNFFAGSISNFRITKGVAVYTGNFTVPTSQLASTQSSGTNISAITGTQTSLLLNTVYGTNLLTDSSSFATSITNIGTNGSRKNPFGVAGNINLTHTTAATVVLSMADLTNFSYTGIGGFTVADMGNTRTFTYGNSAGGSAATAIDLTFTTGASAIAVTNSSWFRRLDYGTTTSTSTGTSISVVESLFLNGTHTAMTFIMVGSGYVSGGASASLLTLTINTTGTITMAGSLTMLGTGSVVLTQGSLVLNSYTITTGIFNSNGTGFTRSINFGTTNIVLAHTSLNQTVLAMADVTGFTWTGTTGGFASNMSATRTFQYGSTAGGSTSNAVNLLLNGGASVATITTGGWYKNLDFTGSTSTPAATTLNIVGNLTLATGGLYTGISATMVGTSTITPSGKTIAAFVVNTSSTITLAAAFGCTTYTQTAGTMDFAAFNMTCSSTVSYTGGTLSNIGTLACTTFTLDSPSFTFSSGTINPSVSFVVTSGSFTYNSPAVLGAVPTFTHTAGNVTLNQAYSLTATGTYRLVSGALSLGGNLTTGIFNTNSQLFRSIAFSTYNIVLSHTTAAQTVLNMADIVNYSQTGTGGFTTAMSVTRSFTSGTQMGIPGSILYSGTQSSLVATNAAFAFSTNIDFTWEAWVYTSVSSTGGGIFNNQNTSADTSGATAFVVGGQAYWYNLGLNSGSGANFGTTAANSIPDNTWTHVVFQRRGTNFEIYINGTLASTYTPSSPINMGASSQRFYIGRDSLGNFYTGRITNIRVVKGTAVYTGNFTVPTLPLAAAQSSDTNISALTGFTTSLMLNAVRGGAFTESSLNGFGFTQSTTAPVTNTSSPFADAYYGQYPKLTITSGLSVATFTSSSLFDTLDFTGSSTAPGGAVSINNLTLDPGATYTSLAVTCVGTGSIIQNTRSLSSLNVNNGYVGGTVTLVTYPLTVGSYTQTSGTIDFSSLTLTVSATYTFIAGTQLNVGTITCTTLAVQGTYNFSSGTVTPSSSVVVTTPGAFTYSGTATLGSVGTFTHTSGSVTLNKDYALTATGTYTLTAGTLTLGGNLSTGIFSSNNTNVRSIAFSTYNITLTHTTAAQTVVSMADMTNFSTTGTGGFTAAASVTRTYTCGTTAGGSATNSLNLSLTGSGTSIQTFTTGGWFNNLSFGTTAFTVAATTLNIEGLTLSSGGTFTNLSINTVGTGTITPNGKAIAALVVNNGSGTSTMAGAFTVTTYTQTSGTVDFASFNLTCSSTASFTAGTLSNIGTISCTTFTVNGTFAHSSGTITPSVSFVITSGSYTQSGTSVLSAVATFTQTAGNVTFRSTQSLTTNGTYTHTAGTLTLDGGNLSTGIYTSSGSNVRSIAFGSYNIVLTHTTAAQTVLSLPDVTNFTRSGTGGFTTAMSVTKTFNVSTVGVGSDFGSLSFNGTSQYLSIANNTALNLSSGDFTIEAWIYWTGVNASATAIDKDGVSVSSYPSYAIAVGSNKLKFVVGSGNGTTYIQTVTPTSATLPTNQWVHVAAVKSGSTLTLYQNGVSVASATQTGTIIDGSKALLVGYETSQPTSSYWDGYISNIRITKGVAVYTGTFTPPKNVLTATQDAGLNINAITGTQTSLLLKTPSNSELLIDSSNNNFTVTNNGAFVPATTTPIPITSVNTGLINGSLSFNGGQYLSIPNNAAFAFGSSSFTVECWFYQTAYAGAGTGNSLVMLWKSGPGRAFNFFVNSGGSLGVGWNTSGSMSGGATSLNTWYHAAFVSDGTNFYLYLNGIQVATAAAATIVASTDSLFIGATNDAASPTWFFNGYISNVRLVKGVAVYTGNFTPTGPLTSTQSSGTNISAITGTQTSVLLNTFYGGFVSPTLEGSTNNFTVTNSGAVSSLLAPILTNPSTPTSPSGLVPSLSLTSGSSIPTFTNNSWFNNLDFTGSSTTPATSTVLIGGNLTLSSGGTYTGLTIIAGGTGNYTTLGKTIPEFFVNTSGTATLADAMTVSGAVNLILGTFDLSLSNLSSQYLISTGTLTRAITGSSTYSVTGSGTIVFFNASATGITITGIIIDMTSASAKTFAGGGGSYSTLNQGGAGALTITGDNSFANITATTRPSTITFTAGSTQTVTDFTLSGTLGNLVTINSTVSGTRFNLSRAFGTTSVGYLNIQDSNATGGASWYADTTSFNVSNNLGWIFTAPPGMYLGNFFAFF